MEHDEQHEPLERIEAPPEMPVEAPPIIEGPATPSYRIGVGAMQVGRSPAGWIALVTVFVLYGLLVFASTTVKTKAKGNQYLSEESEIRTEVYWKDGLRKISPTVDKTVEQDTSPDPTVEKLKRRAPKDSDAARLLVVAEFEHNGKIDQEDLARLKASKSKADQAVASIYSAKSLSKSDAERLSSQIPKSSFAYKVAAARAHELAGDPSERAKLFPAWHGIAALAIFGAGSALGLLGVLLWIFFLSTRQTQFPPKGHPVEPYSLAEADRLAGRAAIMMWSFVGIELVVDAAAYALHGSEAVASAVGSLLVLAMVIAVHRARIGGMHIPLSRIGVTTQNLKKDILWGAGGYVASLPILVVAALIGQLLTKFFGEPSHPATEMIESGASLPVVLSLLLSASVIAPFWEEIMFRGTLLPALSKVLGRPLWGILLSSFIFAAIHPQGITLWLALGSIGAMNAMLAYQTKSLIPCMVLHCLNNTFVLALAISLTS